MLMNERVNTNPDASALSGDPIDKNILEDHPLVQLSLLEIICQAIPTSQLTVIAGALIILLIYLGYTPLPTLISVISIIIILAIIRMAVARHLLKVGMRRYGPARSYLIFNSLAVMMGLAQAVAAIIIPPPDSIILVGFACMLLFAVGGGAVVSLAAVPKTFVLFMASSIGPAALILVATRPYEQQIMGILLIIYSGFLFGIATRQHETFLRNIMLRLQNETLVKQLRNDVLVEHNIRARLEENEELPHFTILVTTPLSTEAHSASVAGVK